VSAVAVSLTIDRFAVDCRVPEETGRDPARSRYVLDRVLGAVSRDLPRALSTSLDTDAASEEIVFIERLRFEVVVNADWSAHELAHAVSARLIRSVKAEVAAPTTVRFRDEAELLACYMADVAQGHAGSRPWHRRFAGLQALPPSAIIRTLIDEDPTLGHKALARLARGTLLQVVTSLKQQDAWRAIEALLRDEAVGACHDALLIANALTGLEGCALLGPQRDLALIAVLAGDGLGADRLTLAIGALVGGGGTATARSTNDAPDFLLSELDGGFPASLHHEAARRIEAAGLAERMPRASLQAFVSVEPRQTALGGLWLLLPQILEFVDSDLEPDQRSLVAFGALVVAAGPMSAPALTDGSLRDALGIPSSDEESHLLLAGALARVESVPPPWRELDPRSWTERRGDLAFLHSAKRSLPLRGRAWRLLVRIGYLAWRTWASRLPGFGNASIAHLWRNTLDTPAVVEPLSGGALSVRLAPPPLDVILRISGVGRATYSLPLGMRINAEVRR
jgi:hypothetical protein